MVKPNDRTASDFARMSESELRDEVVRLSVLDGEVRRQNAEILQLYADLRKTTAERDALAARVERLEGELEACEEIAEDRARFIKNGVELGYIKLPDETDPAWNTWNFCFLGSGPVEQSKRYLARVKAEAVREAIEEYRREYVGQGVEALLEAHAQRLIDEAGE